MQKKFQKSPEINIFGSNQRNDTTDRKKQLQLSRSEIYVANFKAPLQMVRIWTGF